MANNNIKQTVFEYIITDNDHKNINNSKYAFTLFNKSLELINDKFKELEQKNLMVKVNFQDDQKPHFFILSENDKHSLLAFRCIQLLTCSVSDFFAKKDRNIEFYGQIKGYKTNIIIDESNIEEIYENNNLSPVNSRLFQIKKNKITKSDGNFVFIEE